MEIVYYEPKHLKDCQNLFTSIYNAENFNCNFTQEKATAYLEELVNTPRFIGFLFFNKEKLLGLAFCHEKTWAWRDEICINELLIHPDYQRSGLGSRLLSFIEKFAKNRELAGITLVTNTLPLANFYIQNGFMEHDISFLYRGLDAKDS